MISIGFGTNEKFHSKLIRWITNHHHSHVWIEYVSETWDGVWIAHASPKGVVKETQENVYERYPKHVVYDIAIDVKKGLHAVRNDFGADYDYPSVIWNGFLLTIYKVIRWNKLHKLAARNVSKFSCSEFVSKILKKAGVPGADSLDPELTTPADLERFCAESDYFWVV